MKRITDGSAPMANRTTMWRICFALSLAVTGNHLCAQSETPTPLEAVRKVADKVIRETGFQFILAPQEPGNTIQTVDFGRAGATSDGEVWYAVSELRSISGEAFHLGVCHTGPAKVWMNGVQVYAGNSRTTMYQEIAYDIYRFPAKVPVALKSGENRILVKCVSQGPENVVQLALLRSDGMPAPSTSYGIQSLLANQETRQPWLLIGPFSAGAEGAKSAMDRAFPPETAFARYYADGGKFLTWRMPATVLVSRDVLPPEASFRSHSYFEWHYANGQMALAMSLLGEAGGNSRYADWVQKYCRTTLSTLDYFRFQYHVLREYTGYNYRLFRRNMLDDSSAPALPFVQLYLQGILPEAKDLVDSIAAYVTGRQTRLPDGTLCRPEPEAGTVWADDLFMSVPFLLRYGAMTGSHRYYDDAALQVLNMHKHLFDRSKGLAYHGWFSARNKHSVAFWGRANGWILWAVSEALLHLPQSHREYEKILEIFRTQIKGVLRYQNAGGMWHQVLDRPSSYEETSCTAMFVIALSRGIRNGWIDTTYRRSALAGWEAITRKIGPDGTVSAICQGTGIGESEEFYFTRKTPPHDPRGLGAVITAGIEVQQLLDGK
jgi:unsaturated rhamnogalacturonyl hydrolase